MSLAFNKALNISKCYKDDIVIGADTVVVYKDSILGKPKDESDAYEILTLLSGNTHEVITGIALIQDIKNLKFIDYEITKVKFRKLDSKRILNYIKTKEPLDKAGAYGIQGLGELLVEKIDGCYSNVVGLPLTKIDFYLDKYFDTHLL
jgi:septum formation protein